MVAAMNDFKTNAAVCVARAGLHATTCESASCVDVSRPKGKSTHWHPMSPWAAEANGLILVARSIIQMRLDNRRIWKIGEACRPHDEGTNATRTIIVLNQGRVGMHASMRLSPPERHLTQAKPWLSVLRACLDKRRNPIAVFGTRRDEHVSATLQGARISSPQTSDRALSCAFPKKTYVACTSFHQRGTIKADGSFDARIGYKRRERLEKSRTGSRKV